MELLNLVAVMDDLVYNALSSYYHALELKGYMPNHHTQKLMLLIFYRDFCFNDCKGLLSKQDYKLIERALDCLWGSTCLIPYPDYFKMHKLHLGATTELAHRVKVLEDANVLKALSAGDTEGSDIIIIKSEDDD